MAEFFAMGGYGFYVWTSYGLAAAVILGLIGLSARALARVRAEVKALEGGDNP
ncbi:MAG: heme exporter protein CcmD [Alphaproteobacteria bacterium]|nr:heme exporter protein CcmD [Alphaproteobacteria bacterium]